MPFATPKSAETRVMSQPRPIQSSPKNRFAQPAPLTLQIGYDRLNQLLHVGSLQQTLSMGQSQSPT